MESKTFQGSPEQKAFCPIFTNGWNILEVAQKINQ